MPRTIPAPSARREAIERCGVPVKTLVILNDPPYGSERSYNGLRLAGALAKRDGAAVRVFLMGDAASCGQAGQKTPQGFYNIERMVQAVAQAGGEIGGGASCGQAGQKTPQGFYNIERMVQAVAQAGGEIGVCASCMDARGLREAALAQGARRSSLEELADWSGWAERVLVF